MSPEERWMAMGSTRTPRRSVTSGGRQALESVIRATPPGWSPLPTTTHPTRRGAIIWEDAGPVHVPEADRFPVHELVARTGVPAATVHHYLKLGLLPPPHRSSRNRFLYDDRHVQGLRLIRTLRERRGLSLPVIRTILPDLLGLEQEQAFRPEMWDRAVVLHAGRGRRAPAERLLDAAVDAFSRRGYGDVNVDDICKAARIAKGSFYRHHRSKEELFFAAAEAAANEVAEAFGRAMAGGPVPLDRAPEVLAPLIERRVPVFMDLFTRAIERRPGYSSRRWSPPRWPRSAPSPPRRKRRAVPVPRDGFDLPAPMSPRCKQRVSLG